MQSALRGTSRLTAVEREVVGLTVSYANRCPYSMAAHSTFAAGAGASRGVVEALRAGGALPDARLQALGAFTRGLLETRGHISGDGLAAFRRCRLHEGERARGDHPGRIHHDGESRGQPRRHSRRRGVRASGMDHARIAILRRPGGYSRHMSVDGSGRPPASRARSPAARVLGAGARGSRAPRGRDRRGQGDRGRNRGGDRPRAPQSRGGAGDRAGAGCTRTRSGGPSRRR